MLNKFLFFIALLVAIFAGVYYRVYHGCDLENEHDEITCGDVFKLTLLPLITATEMHVIGKLASWGLLDFKSTLRYVFDLTTVNTTLYYTSPDVTQLPVTVADWDINGFQVYSYTPNDVINHPNQPLFIFFHGGGGARITPREYDPSMRCLADKMRMKIISPHYPRSPEYVFPSAHEEFLKIVVHIFEEHERYGVDPNRISLGGDSFGGHAILYIAFKWRELGYNDKYAPILTLTLIYPWVQVVNFDLESFRRKENSPRLLSKTTIITYSSLLISGSIDIYDLLAESRLPLLSKHYKDRQSHYPLLLPKVDWEPDDSMVVKYSDLADKILDPYATFLFQPDYSGLPPTLIINAEYDLLLTEGQLLRDRMMEAGIEVEYVLYEKMFHGFFTMIPPVQRFTSNTEAYGNISEFVNRFIDL